MVFHYGTPHAKAPTQRQLQKAFPGDTRKILETSARFTLFSLDPGGFGHARGKGTFHGYRVLGETIVSGKAKVQLIASLDNAMADGNAFAAACFNPRHGIHAEQDGRSADLVICFQCMQSVVYPNVRPAYTLVSRSAQPDFDRVLATAGVPLSN
jgi:hypothetical protein